MSVRSVTHQERQIRRGVYGLLITVVLTLLLVILVQHLQHAEVQRKDELAHDYHLLVSNKGLELISVIDISRLWFRDHELEHVAAPTVRDHAVLPSHMHSGMSERDQTDALRYELNKLVGEVSAIQAKYADPAFKTITSNLENALAKVQTDLATWQSEPADLHRTIDVITGPLVPVTHQLQRLHQQAYKEMRRSIDDFRSGKQVQIFGLIVVLAVTGLFIIVRLLGYIRHALTDLAMARRKIGESEDYNRMLFEQSPLGLALCDMDGKLVDVNPAYARIIGRSVDDTLDLGYWDITPENYAAEEQQQLDDLDKLGHYGPYEKEYIHKNGRRVPVRLMGSLLKKNGESFILSSVEDITEYKQTSAELDRHRERLEDLVVERSRSLHDAQEKLIRKERLATLGQLTATVSHELRNPLGAMRPSLYVIEKNSDKSDERIQQAIKRVDRSIDRCDNIIDELLDFTRITELNLHATRIDEWLESVIDEQDFPGDIQVDKKLALKDVELSLDADRMRRAVINIVENACHAMLESDHPPKARKGSRLDITTAGNDERVEIIITDTGPGMPENILRKIFEPLFSTKNFGVGLGMASVKQIMEQHKGGIEIESKAGQGTRITLWLPRSVEGIDKEGVAA